MPRRPSTTDPELLAHQQWLGYLQPVGLVVAPAAMQDAGWVVTRSGSELIERQERYRESLEALGVDEDGDAEDRELGFSSIEALLVDHLGWSGDQVQSDPSLMERYTRELPELGETLQPSAVVPAAIGDGVQLLVQELPLLTPLDQKVTGGEHLWRASAQERFERLLRETGVEAGLLFNGSQLRLVVAPKGESSGHITFSLKDLAAVSGRLMFSGLDLLLGQSHVFLDPDGYRLADVLRKSRSFQAVVSNALADQVLAALWELLRGFQQADELTERKGGLLLGHLAEDEPKQLYGGLITVLMRLVFLLYAEDNALLPKDAVYEQNYKVSGVFERLEQDAAEFPDTMQQRYGAWAGLMSLCQLVFAGGGATVDYLPARKGQLFDPAVYPWLETPWISDGVVHEVLSNLLVVKGERISYRALDVEQIGSVYEGIMGYAVLRIPGRCIGLKSKPQGAKKQLTTAVDLDALLALPGAKRKAGLEEQAGTTLPAKSENALKAAASEAELLEALEPRINRELFDGPQPVGSLVFQPTEERRRSGSHYTPRSLTRPIVEEALRPWLERCGGKPTVAQILGLKICDPAMGSGAFLVESCRFLAELLELAWSREALPDALQPGGSAHGEEPLIYARRLIAQSCLYGVDKNPFAVNLARLSLWLVSLSKDAPFTFVDHALKCGDSLVGMERSEIEKALKGASRQREIQMAYLDEVRQQEARNFALFHADSRSDADDAQKRQALKDLNASTAYLRTVGDLLVAAFFNGKKPKDREELKKLYLEATLQHDTAASLENELAEPLEHLREGEKGITPLHWQLAFPDVFGREQPGFDVFVGNPPFLAGFNIWPILGEPFRDFVRDVHPMSDGKAVDLSAHFARRMHNLCREGGTASIVATNTIFQGDTRHAGLHYICKHGGFIYSARKRIKWPGPAAVIVGAIHWLKGEGYVAPMLNGNPAKGINSLLLESSEEANQALLLANKEFSFKGHMILGMGFVFDSTPGSSGGSIEEMNQILRDDPNEAFVIRPFMGGQELNSNPLQEPHRYAICFGEMSLEEAESFPLSLSVVRRLVYPERSLIGGYSVAEARKQNWWKYGSYAKALEASKKGLSRFLCLSQVSVNHSLAFVEASTLVSHAVVAFPFETYKAFSILQSRIHEVWSRLLGSSMKDDLR
ncbi:MAG: N-6 DNA methylase [Cyanobacteria bacterium]|nr:N-6 DNA methylase [Cyanobacteriota bacterium]